MNQELLKSVAKKLVESPKGILAIDESTSTCTARFEKLGVVSNEETRQDYREMLVTAPGIEQYVSGYILYDETLRQSTKAGKKFAEILRNKNIQPGIKVDEGLKEIPGSPTEKFTVGLEGLPARLKEYKELGATFAKWRSVYTIAPGLPTKGCMELNARNFAEYAHMCQEAGIVPIVEPEVLLDGTYTIEESFRVTGENLDIVFSELQKRGVYIPGMILKTSMVLPGKDYMKKSLPEEVAAKTLECLKAHVPQDIGGIVFLSGGQSDEDAILNLNAMHKGGKLPWPLTFSYGRAIQNEALKAWAKNPKDYESAQKLLVDAAHKNSLASMGQYK